MDLRGQLRILRARLRVVIGCLVFAIAAAILGTLLLPRTWQSDSKLIVGNSIGSNTPDYNAQLLAQQLAQTYAEIATTVPVMQNVITRMNLPLTVDQLRSRVSTDVPRNLNIVDITASYGDAATAAGIANTVADELVKSSASVAGGNPGTRAFVDQQLAATQNQIEDTRKEIEQLQAVPGRTPARDAELTSLENRLATLNNSYAALLTYASGNRANQLSVVQPAPVPTDPSSPKPLLNLLVALIAGSLAGVALAFALDHVDDKIRSPGQVRDELGLPTLVSIGRLPAGTAMRNRIYGLVAAVYPKSPAAESFRMLRTSLEFTSLDEDLRSLAVVSAGTAEGKTTVAANLAVVFAQAGRRTLLVDADLRRPTAHEALSLENVLGLSSVLTGTVALEMALQKTVEPNLVLLSSGPIPPNPAEMLSSKRMASLLTRLRDTAEIVIIDTPPIAAVTDGAILAREVGTAILIVDATRTGRGAARQSVETLRRLGVRIVGVALNRVGDASLTAYGYYGSDAPTDLRATPTATSRFGQPRPEEHVPEPVVHAPNVVTPVRASTGGRHRTPE
jgi:polysaccharide biosynthesis transport protein